MNYLKIEDTLNRLGLWKAARGTPALAGVVVVFVTVSYFALRTVADFSVAGPELYLITVVAGTVLAMIGYYAGDFWDGMVFDRLYSPSGRWINRDTRPFHVFPAGDDLRRARANAVAKFLPGSPDGGGVYRKAKDAVQRSKAKWEVVEQPLILSKFLRAFIWPAGLASLALVSFGIRQKILNDERANSSLGLGALTGAIFFLTFVPYLSLRVEHMLRLYESASRPGPSR